MATIQGIVNQALDAIGYPERISHIYEGSKASNIALDLFTETRDEAFALSPWFWARGDELLVTAGVTPPPPWTQEYTYPASSITLLLVYPTVLTTSEPTPCRFIEGTDTRVAAPYRVILTDINPARARFTQRVSDPTGWPPDFVGLVVTMLIEKMRHALAEGSMDKVKDDGSESRGRIQQRA